MLLNEVVVVSVVVLKVEEVVEVVVVVVVIVVVETFFQVLQYYAQGTYLTHTLCVLQTGCGALSHLVATLHLQ